MLVLLHSRLKGWPARQVCFLHHGLTPCLLWHGCGPKFPQFGNLVGNRVPAVQFYLCHSEALTPLPAQHCHKHCMHPVAQPAVAPAFTPWPWGRGDFFPSPWPFLLHWAHGTTWPCLGWQLGCQRQVLCSSWMVTQPGNQHGRMGGGKPSWPS